MKKRIQIAKAFRLHNKNYVKDLILEKKNENLLLES